MIDNYELWPEINQLILELGKGWGFSKADARGFAQWMHDLSGALSIKLLQPCCPQNVGFKCALILPFIQNMPLIRENLKNYGREKFWKAHAIKFGLHMLVVTLADCVEEKWWEAGLNYDCVTDAKILETKVTEIMLAPANIEAVHETNRFFPSGGKSEIKWLATNPSVFFFNAYYIQGWNKRRYADIETQPGICFTVDKNIYGRISICLPAHDLANTAFIYLLSHYNKGLKKWLRNPKKYLRKIVCLAKPDLEESEANQIVNDAIPSSDFFFPKHWNEGLLTKVFYYLINFNLKKSSNDSLDKAYQRFSQYLDQELLVAAKSVQSEKDGLVYNWLVNGSKRDNNINYRLQALHAYPALAHESGIGKYLGYSNQDNITSAIDNANPLEPVIAQEFRIPENVVRSLHGFVLTYAEKTDTARTILDINESCKKNYTNEKKLKIWPQPGSNARAQWRTLNNNLNSIRILDENNIFDREKAFLLHPNLIKQEIGSATHVSDMVDSFRKQLIGPIVVDILNHEEDQLMKVLLKLQGVGWQQEELTKIALIMDRTPAKIVQISDRWHNQLGAINTAMGASCKDQWPALFSPIEINGYQFVPLTSSKELREEGKALKHCVGGYTNKCWINSTHIIGLKKDGKPSSTLELERKDKTLQVIQHHGYSNSSVCNAEKRAVKVLLESIQNEQLPVDWKGLEQARVFRYHHSKGTERAIGYSCKEPMIRNQVFSAWSFAIKREHRNLTHAQWAQALNLEHFCKRFIKSCEV